MNRSEARDYLRAILGVETSDKLYTDARLNALLTQAHHSVVSKVREANPRYLTKTGTVTLSSYEGTLPSDYASVLEVRVSTSTGTELNQVLRDDLSNISSYNFAITGEDSAATIAVAPGVMTGSETLWLRYNYWPLAWDSDTDPAGIPTAYHEVLVLEAAILAFEFGSEEAVPQFLVRRHADRLGSLLAHTQARGIGGTSHLDYVSRLGMRQLIRGWLGLEDTDPQVTDNRLNLWLIAAHQALTADIQETNPSFYTETTTLTAASDHTYVLPVAGYKQANGFARALEVRLYTAEGAELDEVRADELGEAGPLTYAIVQPQNDAPPAAVNTLTLITSAGTEAQPTIWLRYVYWPRDFDEEYENTTPDGIPHHFADVVALEALQLSGLNKNQLMYERWLDRRAQLMLRIGRLSKDVARQRLVDPTTLTGSNGTPSQ